MQLRGIDFGNVWGASGVQGFFGEGYWFHPIFKPFGLVFDDMVFVAKTGTAQDNKGKMPLTMHYTPRDFFPDCIKAKPLQAVMLNAIGISNPGLWALVNAGQWQQRTSPFVISLTSIATTPELRLHEFGLMVRTLQVRHFELQAPFAIQVNLSCPNTGHDPKVLIGEAAQVLDMLSALRVPLMPKFSIASAPIPAVMELQNNPHCDAICVSNTVPYDYKGLGQKIWGEKQSPLAHYGGGGISGAVLLPYVCQWIRELRDAGFTKPINGGGGIMSTTDVDRYHAAGASSIFLGSVATQRPWRVRKIINYSNQIDWR